VHYRSLGKADYSIQKKTIGVTFANDKHFPALQAADMVAFLAKHEANEQFNQVPNIWRHLFDRLTTEPKPPYGIMKWRNMFADEDTLVNFAREAQEMAERAEHEREEKRNRVRKVRSGNDGTAKGSPQQNQREAGSGESDQTIEASNQQK
jgi:hypothetical protein